VSPKTKLRRTLALALAGGSLAIGVPAALAAGGSDSGTSSDSGTPAPGFVQDEQQQPPDRPNGEGQQNRPDGDCPEHDGAQGDGAQGDGAGSGSSGSSDSGTSTPEV
jgi:hypothetical protein